MSVIRLVGTATLSLLVMFGTTSINAQDADSAQPEAQRRLELQLEAIREREKWLLHQLERAKNGETIEENGPWGEPPRRGGPAGDAQPRELREDEMLAVIRDFRAKNPESAEYSPFHDILDSDGPDRKRLLRRLEPRLRKLVDLRERSPEQYEARLLELSAGMQIAKAARELGMIIADADASEADQDTASENLRAAISAAFDAKSAVAKQELADVQAKLDALTQEIADAEEQRQARIDRQFEAILSKIKAGGWMRTSPDRRGPGREDRGRRSGND